MPKFLDLKDRKIGVWTVLERIDVLHGNKSRVEWKCSCENGHIVVRRSGALKNTCPDCKVALTYENALAIVHPLHFAGMIEYKEWVRCNPERNLSVCPDKTYKSTGWKNWSAFLNTKPRRHCWTSFIEAREFVRGLGLRSKKQWTKYSKSGNRPDNIPSKPDKSYKDEWLGWEDFLGLKQSHSRPIWRPYDEAVEYVRKLGFSTKREWEDFCKSGTKPDDIPFKPDRTYKNQWRSWSAWLTAQPTLWNANAIKVFLEDIRPHLSNMSSAELYSILRSNGLMGNMDRHRSKQNRQIVAQIQHLCDNPSPDLEVDRLVQLLEEQTPADASELGDTEIAEQERLADKSTPTLPILTSFQTLKDVDALKAKNIISDIETIEFLIQNRVALLWDSVMNEPEFNEATLRAEEGGLYFGEIRRRFLDELDAVRALAVPSEWSFRRDSKLIEPNLMQRLTAYRVLTRRRLGNWSGVGAGKTASALLASRVIRAGLTVIIGFNSTLESWETVTSEIFPDTNVILKERGDFDVDTSRPNILLLNYESFSQPDTNEMVERLVSGNNVDFIVLDEAHFVRQRDIKLSSQRRMAVKALIEGVASHNESLCVLGMSATPVVNNIQEGKGLLELISGQEMVGLKTSASIENAINLHQKLIMNGVRYRPRYEQTIITNKVEVNGDYLLGKLLDIKKNDIVGMERVLLQAKLDSIVGAAMPGTLIYTHYKTGMVQPLRDALHSVGRSVSVFSGDDKSGLSKFLNHESDVLIGTIPVATGVDGLQYHCNRMIIACLPWTGAEYQQLIGRLFRQGSLFKSVEVIIPQVVLSHQGKSWSWDQMRMERIEFKRTLADAALDGIIPEGQLASESVLLQRAYNALQSWIERIS